MAPSDQRALLLDLAAHVIVHADRIEASIDSASLGGRLGIDASHSGDDRIELSIPTQLVRRGIDVKLTIKFDAPAPSAKRDPKLVELIVRADEAKRMLGLDGKPPTVCPDLEYQQRNHLARIARFSFLAPEITAAILEGSQPAGLSARKLMRASELPMDWKQQREMFGFR